MDKIALKIFRYSNAILIGLLSIPIILFIFFLCCYVVYIVQPESSFLLFIIILGPPILFAYILNFAGSKLIYRNIGKLTCQDNQLVINCGKEILIYNANSIQYLKFEYRGDYLWRARNPKLQRLKSETRYISHKATLIAYGREDATFDKLIINGRKFYIKIKDFNDKGNFFQLVNWAAEQGIKYELIEDKYYMKFN